MKLMIDIPDYNLDEVQNGSLACGMILRAVKDGTALPEEYRDLIDRKALTKALKSGCDVCVNVNTAWCEHCCPYNDFEDLIDEAPVILGGDSGK